ncbi:MAG TPA: rhodanese-like domain-containing protein, partial [Elusimicrobiota bacterium]|nr:rhodanese-like domain-containing protein [Elusimicrobiota bacterium]
GVDAFVVVDPRSAEAYAKGHVPGALNLPYREIDRDAVSARLPQGKVYVLCCAGIGCNASAKAAIRLAAFGCAIKELVGGLEWWQKSGYPVQTGAEPGRLE